MKAGDLVDVRQALGCDTPPRRYRHRGMGIIFNIVMGEVSTLL